MDDFEAELRKSFLEEADDLLSQAEAIFIAIDAGSYNDEQVNHIFRIAHNIKGSAKSVGFDGLAAFAHTLEDALTLLKNKELTPTKGVCTLFFESLDTLRTFTAGLRDDINFNPDVSDVAAQLKNIKDLEQGSGEVPAFQESVVVEGVQDVNEMENQPIQAAPVKTQKSNPSVSKNSESDAIRVSTRKLDMLVNSVGELVVNLTILTDHKQAGTLGSEQALVTLGYVEKIVTDLQERAMMLRMVPIKPLFQKLQRAARDAAAFLGKDVNVVLEGEDIELDKSLIDRMTDPLTHLVRNAVDHGLEDQPTRHVSGKSPTGTVIVRAEQKEDHANISVIDDGKGLDEERILAKAKERKLVSESATPSRDEIFSFVFAPGFSTKEKVSELSGRGVGLDVVQATVTQLKGNVKLESEFGKGSQFVVSVPLSLSIIAGIVVEIDKLKYVIPVPQLLEIVNLDAYTVLPSTGSGRMINLRGEVVPVFSLSEMLHGRKPTIPTKDKDNKLPPGVIPQHPSLVTVYNGKKVSFEVNEVIGQQQIVLKKLGDEVHGVPALTAGAVLSNGEPGVVINLHQLAEKKLSAA